MSKLTEEDKSFWKNFMEKYTNEKIQKIDIEEQKYISKTLDLHTFTINDAYNKVNDYINYCKTLYKEITIITGKSGKIFEEFPIWMENNKNVNHIELLKNGGSFKVFLQK